MLGAVGMDPLIGRPRFSFGSSSLLDGVGLVPVAMGLFGISEVLMNIETGQKRSIFKTKVKNLFPNLQDWKKSIGPIGRGSVLGFLVGILPGGGQSCPHFSLIPLRRGFPRIRVLLGRGDRRSCRA